MGGGFKTKVRAHGGQVFPSVRGLSRFCPSRVENPSSGTHSLKNSSPLVALAPSLNYPHKKPLG